MVETYVELLAEVCFVISVNLFSLESCMVVHLD